MDLKDAKPIVSLEVLGYSEFREVLRDADDLVPAPCGFVHMHVRTPEGAPFTVLVAEEVFQSHVLPRAGFPNLALVPRHEP